MLRVPHIPIEIIRMMMELLGYKLYLSWWDKKKLKALRSAALVNKTWSAEAIRVL